MIEALLPLLVRGARREDLSHTAFLNCDLSFAHGKPYILESYMKHLVPIEDQIIIPQAS
ncbi:MAG: hypothetical protein OXC40_05450 [Proteobacteria bacterium]|nr:hypothetical protein [Pseudomonadota bacterium]